MPAALPHTGHRGTRSLPWGQEWWARDTAYNLDRLIAETEALLTASTPVIVRMETIRRASIYASHSQRVAEQLFSRVIERAGRSESAGRPDALVLFDAAYMATMFAQISSFQGREVGSLSARMKALVSQADEYVLVRKSLAVRPDDPALHFGAALIASRRKEHHAAAREHAHRAREGAAGDPWLERICRTSPLRRRVSVDMTWSTRADYLAVFFVKECDFKDSC